MAAEPPPLPGRGSGGQARLLASGSLLQQLSQVTGLVALVAILTVLARRLSLEELGVYGLLASMAGYLVVIQNSAASAAVRSMAAAPGAVERDRAFSTAVLVYALAGVSTGALMALVGIVLATTVELAGDVQREAQLGAAGLGLVTAVGWPITIYRDALRARLLFVPVAKIEIAALCVFAGLVLGLAFAGAGLAVLIAASGTIPLLVGLGAAVAARAHGIPFRFRIASASRAEAAALTRLAGHVSVAEAAGTIVYLLHRVILGVFKSATTVGLYEGPVRAHNIVRAVNGAVSVTVLPTAAGYFREGDDDRLKELLLRGMRYMLALVVPLVVTGIVLAEPLLEVWLGPGFREGAIALAILMSYWLVNGCSGVIQAIVIAGDHARTVARIAVAVAVANLGASLALVTPLGLEGIAIATAVPYFAAFPFLLSAVRELVPVTGREVLRIAFVPAFSLGLALAAALLTVRVLVPLDSIAPFLAVAGGGIGGYWLAYYALWFLPHERTLVRELAGRRTRP